MLTAFSSTVRVRTLTTLPATGRAAGGGLPAVAPLAVQIMSLIGGFCARATPDAAGWFKAYGVRSVGIAWRDIDELSDLGTARVYDVEEVQNLTVQKTLLVLRKNSSYEVRFELFNAENDLIYRSLWRDVQTLNNGAPVSAQ